VVRKLFFAENAIRRKFYLKIPKMSRCPENEGSKSAKEQIPFSYRLVLNPT
jgi:hypothetical protein